MFLIAVAILVAGSAGARTLHGKVIEVTDGDTITVLSSGTSTHRVRIAGIDAPERDQVSGDLAREHLRRILRNQVVRVEWEHMDAYGRIVGVLTVIERDGKCLNPDCEPFDPGLSMLLSGFAWQDRLFQGPLADVLRDTYIKAEQQARAKKTGIWREAGAQPPWIWRTNQRKGLANDSVVATPAPDRRR